MFATADSYYRRDELRDRMYKLGTDTYDFEKEENYKNWYLDKLEEYYSNLDGYDELVAKIQSTPASEFYKKLGKSDQAENDRDIYWVYKSLFQQAEFDVYKNRVMKALGD